MRQRGGRGGENAGTSMGGNVPAAGRGEPNEASLEALAQKLATLREHLQQVVAVLNERREFGRPLVSSLRCHECGRSTVDHQGGWTLRLCGDDELHPFCPDCDRRRVDGID